MNTNRHCPSSVGLDTHGLGEIGRGSNGRFIVEQSGSREDIWWGKVNKPISEAQVDGLHQLVIERYNG